MPDEALLLGIAQLAVVIAGFTAVTSALTPPGGSWAPGLRILHRAIVSTSFNVMFESLLPLVAFAWLADQRGALVVSSAVVAVYGGCVVVIRGRQMVRAATPTKLSTWVMFAAGPLAVLLFATNAIVFVSVAVYALALGIQLSVAVISFYTLVAAATS